MTVKHSGNAFELVATVCGFDSQSKLVNLATRLQGQAYPIYCTCTVQQCFPDESLVMACHRGLLQ